MCGQLQLPKPWVCHRRMLKLNFKYQVCYPRSSYLPPDTGFHTEKERDKGPFVSTLRWIWDTFLAAECSHGNVPCLPEKGGDDAVFCSSGTYDCTSHYRAAAFEKCILTGKDCHLAEYKCLNILVVYECDGDSACTQKGYSACLSVQLSWFSKERPCTFVSRRELPATPGRSA